jgi:FkbM family methyltransferase
MNPVSKVAGALRSIAAHPVNRNRKFKAVMEYGFIQVAARLVPGDVCVPFPNDTRLLVPPHMKGAAHFINPGLCEFNDMGFVLHFLRSPDLFVDIGANIGAYTVLAGGAIGSNVIAFEPVPETFRSLFANIQLNGLAGRVTAHNLALGKDEGVLQMSAGLGTENAVRTAGNDADTVKVKVSTLDRVLGDKEPVLLKIDVEGFETEAFAGGRATLAKPSLQAMVIEKNGSGARYNFDEDALHREIRGFGFQPCAYSPLDRTLSRQPDTVEGNIVYVRDFDAVQRRTKEALPFRYREFSI